jgi:hypothetical protein
VTLAAVIFTSKPAPPVGAVYVAEVEDVWVKVPLHAGPKVQEDFLLNETPRLLWSFMTVAVKIWLPPSVTLALTGETVTLIGGSAEMATWITVTLPLMTFAT